MLRFINPALVAPEAYHISKTVPGPTARRNLTLISKLVQNISNGVISSSKEPFMAEFSDFVDSQHKVMANFLEKVVAAAVDTSDKPAIPVDEADVGFIEGRHLAFLLHLLNVRSEELTLAVNEQSSDVKRDVELISVVRMVQQEQTLDLIPLKALSGVWLSKHYFGGLLTREREKKRKKIKKVIRMELTRSFIYVMEDGVQPSADTIKYAVPLRCVKPKLKQKGKKDTVLELRYYEKNYDFASDVEVLTAWATQFTAALSDHSSIQSGNYRFTEKPSKGAVADVLTAHNGFPKLAYVCKVKPEKSRNAAMKIGQTGMAAMVTVSAFGYTWDVSVSMMQASASVELLNIEVDGKVIVPPLPHVFHKTEDKERDFSLHYDSAGNPSLGVLVFRDWLAAFLEALQTSPLLSHSKPLLDLLQLTSPFRAGKNGLAHLKWIHRYIVGGLALKNKRGVNVLMQIVEEPPSCSASEALEMVRFLVDSRAVNLRDVDVDGNSVLHRAFKAKAWVKAMTLCEMGVDHARNKSGRFPLHVAVSEISDTEDEEMLDAIDACIKSSLETKMVEGGNVVTSYDDKGKSVLHYAVMSGSDEVVSMILEAINTIPDVNKPLPNAGKVYLLHEMIASGMEESAEKAIEYGLFDHRVLNSDGQSVLHVAARAGKIHLVKLLCEKLGKGKEFIVQLLAFVYLVVSFPWIERQATDDSCSLCRKIRKS